jgi:hypothetical protein
MILLCVAFVKAAFFSDIYSPQVQYVPEFDYQALIDVKLGLDGSALTVA